MTNCAELVDRLRFLAADMRATAADMMCVQIPSREQVQRHAAEMQGAAEVAEEWADEIAAESIP